MIVRIMGEGQWEVPDDTARRLNVLDDMVAEAVDSRDPDQLGSLLTEMGEVVRRVGKRVTAGGIVFSDLIVPHPDSTVDQIAEWMQEARADDGLFPG
ncbi:MAG: PspA-associated protein PspAA [Brooklawnia sp.]|jgi:hypothetical protein